MSKQQSVSYVKAIKGKAVAAILWCINPQTQTEEILMIKRHSWMRVFPGYSAFPGGKIESAETDLEALKREISEEIDVEFDISHAIFHGVATTPESHPYRFETLYYSIELNPEQKNAITHKLTYWQNHPEFEKFEWVDCQNILSRYLNGELLMVPLVRYFLQDVIDKGIKNAKMVNADNIKLAKVYFALEMQAGIVQLFIPSKTLPPQIFTNCFLINASTNKLGVTEQKVIMVDPAPIDEEEWKKMIQIFEQLKIIPEKIICTHHHIDHCSFLSQTAKHFNVPVLMHEKTFELTPDLHDIRSQIQFINSDTTIGKWKNKPILIQHIPGHAAGHIALTTSDGDFYIAGDLFQSEGSVVIGGKQSSMRQYMQSLHKVIDFNPRVVYPSHGIPLGSTLPLKKLIKHRLLRHQDVANLKKEGFSSDEMTKTIYSEISEELFKYAHANVESHLNWLNEEPIEEVMKTYESYL